MTTYANIYNPAFEGMMGDRERFFKGLQYPQITPRPMGGMPFGGQGISPMLVGIKRFLQQKPNENLDQFMSELEEMINNYGSNQTTTTSPTFATSPAQTSPVQEYPVDENLDNAMNSGIYGLNSI
mgnify:CR=1 FL=1|jgi:hypothetical protein